MKVSFRPGDIKLPSSSAVLTSLFLGICSLARFEALGKLGVEEDNIEVYKVPGAFEIPLLAKKLAAKKQVDGLICLGALIRGDTPHFDYLSSEVTKGLSQVAIEEGLPISFGILTVETVEQAIERAGTKAGNKGYEAALALIETINLLKQAKLG